MKVPFLTMILLLFTNLTFAANIDGKWEGVFPKEWEGVFPKGINGQPMKLWFDFKAEGKTLKGTTVGAEDSTIEIKNGKIDGNYIYFEVHIDEANGMKSPIVYEGLLSGDILNLYFSTKLESTPDEMNMLDKGQYRVEVKKGGYDEYSETVTVRADEQANLFARLDTWTDPVTGMEFVLVPGGCYQMGCGSWDGDCERGETPAHEVCVDGFWIGKYEVTQGQWEKVMSNNPSLFTRGDNYPVERVSWNDVKNFIKKLASMNKNGYEFRLPTEAEWEYAARSGGKKEKYSGVSNLESLAWYKGNSNNSTHPVGTKLPNGLGIYDMIGNVREWCDDWYGDDYYLLSPKNNPKGPSSGYYYILRGGSWHSYPKFVRSAGRDRANSVFSYFDVGFRVVLLPSQ